MSRDTVGVDTARYLEDQLRAEGFDVAVTFVGASEDAYLDHVDREEARADDCWCSRHGEEHDELCERRRHGDR